MTKQLKGERFLNRYRITGTLKTVSPLHVGTGEETEAVYSESEVKKIQERLGKVPSVATVMKDANGKPLIPGSTLKGVMRHWLHSVLVPVGHDWAASRNYEDEALTELSQEQQIDKVKSEFSWLEILFGTPFHEGKIEVWDAACKTASLPAPDKLLSWNCDTLTYIDTSVAIDPATGTAIERLLYKMEIVPPGVEFSFNLTGQNLSDKEIGLILLALQGFNSTIYPIKIGALGGRGFGRVKFIPGSVHGLHRDDLNCWIRSIVQSFGTAEAVEHYDKPEFDGRDAAGYFALPELSKEKQDELIQAVKAQLTAAMGE
ncbi:MAG: hypothetical protein JXA78_00015 [Anaerolineales bacterium]|nr:hypothetical protein [Anaerolineales bacterium]